MLAVSRAEPVANWFQVQRVLYKSSYYNSSTIDFWKLQYYFFTTQSKFREPISTRGLNNIIWETGDDKKLNFIKFIFFDSSIDLQ